MATSFAKRLIFSVALALVVLPSSPASAEWQFKPFVGLTFGGETTYLVDFEQAAGGKNLTFGGSALWLGRIVGIEGDWGYGPGFFETGEELVKDSSVMTFTGNVVLALPRDVAQYTLRPYFVGGFGWMRVRATDTGSGAVFTTSSSLAAYDIGGGVTGFLTDRVGLNWDLRWFNSLGKDDTRTLTSTGTEELSFWRATMGVAVRY